MTIGINLDTLIYQEPDASHMSMWSTVVNILMDHDYDVSICTRFSKCKKNINTFNDLFKKLDAGDRLTEENILWNHRKINT